MAKSATPVEGEWLPLSEAFPQIEQFERSREAAVEKLAFRLKTNRGVCVVSRVTSPELNSSGVIFHESDVDWSKFRINPEKNFATGDARFSDSPRRRGPRPFVKVLLEGIQLQKAWVDRYWPRAKRKGGSPKARNVSRSKLTKFFSEYSDGTKTKEVCWEAALQKFGHITDADLRAAWGDPSVRKLPRGRRSKSGKS